MSLSQSLFTAISGLINHQTRLDTVGNNLANINTVGYKRSVLRFQDILSQTIRGGSAPNGNWGGTNPLQIGLGMQVASSGQDFGQGGLEMTGRLTDLAIEGDGFFKVTCPDKVRYTRDGSFTLGQDGDLVTANGFRVQGWMADANGAIDTTLNTTDIIIPLGERRLARQTSNVDYTGNLNAAGSVATTNTALSDNNNVSLSDGLREISSGNAAGGGTLLSDLMYDDAGAWTTLFAAPAASGDTITINALKGSRTVSATIAYDATTTLNDLTTAMNSIFGIQAIDPQAGITLEAQAGPPASNAIKVVGNLGTLNGLTDIVLRHGTSAVSMFSEVAAANGESAATSTIVYDSLGSPHVVTLTLALVARTNTDSTWRWYADCDDDTSNNGLDLAVGTGTVTFDSGGQFFSESTDNITIDLVNQGVATALVVDPDFSVLTQFANASGSELNVRSQDGVPMGVLTSFSIGENGVVSGLYSNGLNEDLAQLCITRFANNNGLERDAESMYKAGRNSGLAQDGVALASGRGAIREGTLESSNVDMAQEFTDMIVTQRGFQANARTISTSDEMLVELINLTR